MNGINTNAENLADNGAVKVVIILNLDLIIVDKAYETVSNFAFFTAIFSISKIH